MSIIHRADESPEAGVVSIFIVIFFMIFMSVIVVGFVKMVNDDQSQSTDNDLSTSALASAQSGAEDGKRALLFCKTATGANKTACNTALASASCNAITSNATLTGALNINVDTAGGRSDGIVSANSGYQQRYTCMTIKTATDSVEGISVEKGSSELIPLTATGTFTSVQFSWHATADGRNGPLNAFRTNTLLPAEDQWKNGANAYAAAMRLEFIAYPKAAGANLTTLDADTRSILLLPGSNGGASVTTRNLNASDARDVNPNNVPERTPVLARCQTSTEYACTMNIDLAGPRLPANYNYYLRVSAIYGSAYIKAELKNGANTVQFNDVQPLIDVTGRANDVFRRIQTRVQYDAPMYLPQYAVETGNLCKNMIVTDRSATSSYLCP